MCPAQVAQTFVEMAFIARAEKFYTAHKSNFANAALAWANRTAVTVPTSGGHKLCTSARPAGRPTQWTTYVFRNHRPRSHSGQKT